MLYYLKKIKIFSFFCLFTSGYIHATLLDQTFEPMKELNSIKSWVAIGYSSEIGLPIKNNIVISRHFFYPKEGAFKKSGKTLRSPLETNYSIAQMDCKNKQFKPMYHIDYYNYINTDFIREIKGKSPNRFSKEDFQFYPVSKMGISTPFDWFCKIEKYLKQ